MLLLHRSVGQVDESTNIKEEYQNVNQDNQHYNMYVHTNAATGKTKIHIKEGSKYSSDAVLISIPGCSEGCPELCPLMWSFNPELFSNRYDCLSPPFAYNCHLEMDDSLKLTCSKTQCVNSYIKYFTKIYIYMLTIKFIFQMSHDIKNSFLIY